MLNADTFRGRRVIVTTATRGLLCYHNMARVRSWWCVEYRYWTGRAIHVMMWRPPLPFPLRDRPVGYVDPAEEAWLSEPEPDPEPASSAAPRSPTPSSSSSEDSYTGTSRVFIIYASHLRIAYLISGICMVLGDYLQCCLNSVLIEVHLYLWCWKVIHIAVFSAEPVVATVSASLRSSIRVLSVAVAYVGMI